MRGDSVQKNRDQIHSPFLFRQYRKAAIARLLRIVNTNHMEEMREENISSKTAKANMARDP